MNTKLFLLALLTLSTMLAVPVRLIAQPATEAANYSNIDPAIALPNAGENYVRPSEMIRMQNYLVDTIGPYPVIGAAAVAGINQAYNTPPEWKQGSRAYGKRFASNFGIEAVSTTTRYALAGAFKEDTIYYRCNCTGFLPRLNHAVLSTFTARHGQDGHRMFSISSLVAPYVGTTTAVYGWYPDRYGAKDAFRMGNYNLLGSVGANIAREFFYGGLHSMFGRKHMNDSQTAAEAEVKR